LIPVFKSYRKSRGDGNCFFRSFAFRLFESFCGNPNFKAALPLLKENWNVILASAGFDKIAYEDFLEEAFTLLQVFHEHIPILRAAGVDPSEWLAEDWRSDMTKSNVMVISLRMLVSAHLQLNADEYLPFIYEHIDPALTSQGPRAVMNDYCRRHVEAMDVESDQIHIIAMTKVMGCEIEIVYLDASQSEDNMVMRFGESTDVLITDAISLLYRPGHYDMVYRS